MTTLPKAPFTLPEQPVDLHTVRWWKVDSYFLHHLDMMISARSATYYVNAKYKDHNGRDGAALVDQWMYQEDGRNVGRSYDGWTKVLNGNWSLCFATEKEAIECAVGLVKEKIDRLLDDVDALKRVRQALNGRL